MMGILLMSMSYLDHYDPQLGSWEEEKNWQSHVGYRLWPGLSPHSETWNEFSKRKLNES